MKIPAFHIDAFAGAVFSGNPAMVCLLDRWLGDETLQLIARENHVPVTAFLVEGGETCELRWFTPSVELGLCGHGTWLTASMPASPISSMKDSRGKFATLAA